MAFSSSELAIPLARAGLCCCLAATKVVTTLRAGASLRIDCELGKTDRKSLLAVYTAMRYTRLVMHICFHVMFCKC